MDKVSSSVGNDPMIQGARRGGEYSMARYAPAAKEIVLTASKRKSRRERCRERLCTTTTCPSAYPIPIVKSLWVVIRTCEIERRWTTCSGYAMSAPGSAWTKYFASRWSSDVL
jgi:hypothetical protein